MRILLIYITFLTFFDFRRRFKFALDEQHYQLFEYISENKDLIVDDKDAFIEGFESAIIKIIDPREISKRGWVKRLHTSYRRRTKEI